MQRKNIHSANMAKALQKAKSNVTKFKKGGCVSMMKLPSKKSGGGCGCK